MHLLWLMHLISLFMRLLWFINAFNQFISFTYVYRCCLIRKEMISCDLILFISFEYKRECRPCQTKPLRLHVSFYFFNSIAIFYKYPFICEQINRVRHAINLALGSRTDMAEWGPEAVASRIQAPARDQLMK